MLLRPPQIGGQDRLVLLDVRGRPAGHDLAEVEDVHLVADAHHQAHIVFDEDDRAAVGGDVAQQGGESAGLVGVLSRGGFVEEEDAGPPGEGPADFQEAGGAGGQRVGGGVGNGGQADGFQDTVGGTGRLASVGAEFGGDKEVVADGEPPEQFQALEGTGHAAPGALGGGGAGDVLAVEGDDAGLGPAQPGDDVEQGGFSCPVGADEAGDAACLGFESGVVQGPVPAEHDGHAVSSQRYHGRSPPGPRSAMAGGCPTIRRGRVRGAVRPAVRRPGRAVRSRRRSW